METTHRSTKPRIQQVIDGSDRPQTVFQPTPDFYQLTGIGRKRFGQIYRGERSLLLSELEALANYLGVAVSDFIG